MTVRNCGCERADCPTCGPLVALAETIRTEFQHSKLHARVPTPEIVWWRAQMRAREEAARRVARPILLSQALAVAAIVGLLVALVGRVTLPTPWWPDVTLIPDWIPLVPIAIVSACWLVLAPVAVFLALSRE
jgi:hypothetical protein